MHKEVDPVEPNSAPLDPPDADFTYSAKVLLLICHVIVYMLLLKYFSDTGNAAKLANPG
jgi:hypothetical protein